METPLDLPLGSDCNTLLVNWGRGGGRLQPSTFVKPNARKSGDVVTKNPDTNKTLSIVLPHVLIQTSRSPLPHRQMQAWR